MDKTVTTGDIGKTISEQKQTHTTHWAVELYERFIALSKEGDRILGEVKKEHEYARGTMSGRANQASECASDLYLWAPTAIKKKIRERQNVKD